MGDLNRWIRLPWHRPWLPYLEGSGEAIGVVSVGYVGIGLRCRRAHSTGTDRGSFDLLAHRDEVVSVEVFNAEDSVVVIEVDLEADEAASVDHQAADLEGELQSDDRSNVISSDCSLFSAPASDSAVAVDSVEATGAVSVAGAALEVVEIEVALVVEIEAALAVGIEAVSEVPLEVDTEGKLILLRYPILPTS